MSTKPPKDEAWGEYSSPPCFMHELDPAYSGLAPEPDFRSAETIARWRKVERKRLIAKRLAVNLDARADQARRIAGNLDRVIGDLSGMIVSCYWPFRGEPDLRPWLETVRRRGARTALPVVVAKAAPLAFRLWKDGEPLARGVWNIPFPAAGESAIPDIVIAPLVGFDRAGYRLGYGGGYYDRTLAALSLRRRVIGVGCAGLAIPTIYPQPHDIPMDLIVTNRGVVTPER